MLEWSYRELVNTINESLNDYENDGHYNYTTEQIAERCFYEYMTVSMQGYTEATIIYAEIAKFIIENCSKDFVSLYKNEIKEKFRDFNLEKLDMELTLAERNELEFKIKSILENLY